MCSARQRRETHHRVCELRSGLPRDYHLYFFDVGMLDIVEDMMSSKVFGTISRGTSIRYIAIGKMMIRN